MRNSTCVSPGNGGGNLVGAGAQLVAEYNANLNLMQPPRVGASGGIVPNLPSVSCSSVSSGSSNSASSTSTSNAVVPTGGVPKPSVTTGTGTSSKASVTTGTGTSSKASVTTGTSSSKASVTTGTSSSKASVTATTGAKTSSVPTGVSGKTGVTSVTASVTPSVTTAPGVTTINVGVGGPTGLNTITTKAVQTDLSGTRLAESEAQALLDSETKNTRIDELTRSSDDLRHQVTTQQRHAEQQKAQITKCIEVRFISTFPFIHLFNVV